MRGYEYAKGEYAVLAEDELQALEQKSDQSIEIEQFVPIEKVDPVYFDKAYLLGPDKGGHKPYRLLGAAMRESGKCAVAKFSTRGKQQLVLVRQADEGLVLHTPLLRRRGAQLRRRRSRRRASRPSRPRSSSPSS